MFVDVSGIVPHRVVAFVHDGGRRGWIMRKYFNFMNNVKLLEIAPRDQLRSTLTAIRRSASSDLHSGPGINLSGRCLKPQVAGACCTRKNGDLVIAISRGLGNMPILSIPADRSNGTCSGQFRMYLTFLDNRVGC